MPGTRPSVLIQLSSVFFGSRRARVLSSVFAVVISLLLAYLWHASQRIESVANPVGLGRPDEPVVDAVDPTTTPQVLLLNSYHRGYSWSDNEVDSVAATLRDSEPHASLAVEYLDCKRFARMEHFDRVRELLVAKYGAHRPSVVIAADNPALIFALRYRNDLFAGTPIVFCGINGFEPSMLRGQTDITGVAEVLDGLTTIRAARELQPGIRKVFVVHDYSVTGLASRREVESELRDLKGLDVQYLEDLPLDKLLARVETLPADSVLLALSYSLDADGRVVDHEQIAHLLSSHSPVPVYGLHAERLGYGIIGGSLTGGRLQGRRAAQMAQQLLAGVPASSIPIDVRSPTELMFDYPLLERFHIPAKSVPKAATVVNRPVSLLVSYRGLFASTVALILVLSSGIFMLGLNVFRRQKAEVALSESERKFKTLFESAADIMFIEGEDGRLLDANGEAARVLGYERKELLSLSVREIAAPEYHATLLDSRRHASDGQRAVLECELISRDRTRIRAELHSRAIDFSGGRAVLTIARDLSERLKAEAERDRLFAQFAQAQKMETIGRLAGSVAHDFNNILTSIFGYSQLLLQTLPADGEPRRYVSVIQRAAESAAGLTRQLLALSRKRVVEVHPVSLNDIVDNLQLLLARVLGDQVRIDFRPGVLRPVRADPGQIEQVVMNLVVNARDAMPDGGTIIIETSLTEQPDDPSGRALVKLSVIDSGVGIPPDIQKKIFEPFFTTKEASKGTGLGLATVDGIVRQHDGRISIDSELGKGTTISVCFPAEPDSLDRQMPSTRHVEPQHVGRECVLMVDDDEAIVSVLGVALSSMGYEVLSTSSATEALTLARSRPDSIDMLVTDVVMREMNGRQLANEVRALIPGIKLVFMSGYTDDIIADGDVRALGATMVQKPFKPEELAKEVRAMFEGDA